MHKDERLAVELSFSKVGMVLPLQTLLFVASCVCCNLKIALAGKFGAQLHIGWFEEARLLVMAYKVRFLRMLPASPSAFKSNAKLSLHQKPAVYSVLFVTDDMGKRLSSYKASDPSAFPAEYSLRRTGRFHRSHKEFYPF